MRQFLAYGAVLETGLDLSDYLVQESTGRYRLELAECSATAPRQVLEICTPILSSHGRDLCLLSDREMARSEAGQPWCLEVNELVRFAWAGGSGRIEYEALEQCTGPLLAFWLIHIFLPLYFALEGRYEFIHACAVEVAGDSILFVAPSTGGKSTLADFFLQQGHSLISDDKVATYLDNGRYFAVPSHPNHRPYRKFEDLGYPVEGFSPLARPVDAFYALRRADPQAEAAISEISGSQRFVDLLPSYLFNFNFLKARRFKYLAAMVNTVPIYRVEVPWDLDRLAEVHAAICRHCARPGGAS